MMSIISHIDPRAATGPGKSRFFTGYVVRGRTRPNDLNRYIPRLLRRRQGDDDDDDYTMMII